MFYFIFLRYSHIDKNETLQSKVIFSIKSIKDKKKKNNNFT